MKNSIQEDSWIIFVDITKYVFFRNYSLGNRWNDMSQSTGLNHETDRPQMTSAQGAGVCVYGNDLQWPYN